MIGVIALALATKRTSPDKRFSQRSSGPRKEFEMRNLAKSMVEFLKKEDGPTAVEYAVMLALIIVVCIAAVTTLGSNANSTFSFVGASMKPPAGATGS